jgi:hypothetical protein
VPVGLTLVLAAAAGLSPWLVLMMLAGLATFTSRVPMGPPLAAMASLPAVIALAVLLGVDIVGRKVRALAGAVSVVNLLVGPAAGAALVVALLGGTRDAFPLVAAAGLLVALTARLAVRAAGKALEAPLKPYGAVAAEMAANLVAGTAVAAVIALHR